MPRKVPIRTCIACRTEGPKPSFLRVLRRPDDQVVIDSTGRLPGRGAYICPTPTCLEQAFRRKLLEQALRIPLSEKQLTELKEALKQILEQRQKVGLS